MTYKKKIFLNKVVLINSSGQICIKKHFIFKLVYRYYRFIY